MEDDSYVWSARAHFDLLPAAAKEFKAPGGGVVTLRVRTVRSEARSLYVSRLDSRDACAVRQRRDLAPAPPLPSVASRSRADL